MALPEEDFRTPRLGRKSISRRCSVGGMSAAGSTSVPTTPFLDVPENNDDAERRQRQLSRLQQLQNSHQVGSPNLNSSDRRKSVAALEPRLTGQQLAQHYEKCIQLSAENKISAKNAFNLQLIDYMTEMLRSKDSNMNNFQVASCTLDASTKIYAYRVDNIHTDTMRMAGGLGRTQQDKQQKEGDDPSQPENPIRRKRNKKTATIETNPNSLTLSSLELDFMVDPLFKKIASQFDEGRAGGGLFLNSLSLKDDFCQLQLDSQALMSSSSSTEIKTEDVSVSKFKLNDNAIICPSFSTFHFNNWKVDDEDSFFQDNEDKKHVEEAHAFDVNAIPEPLDDVMDDPGDFGGCDDMAEFDSMAGNDGGNDTALTVGVAGQHYKSVTVPSLETIHLKEHLATIPLEYSYFDSKVISAWAGPSHWKLKSAVRNKLSNIQQGKEDKPSRKKEPQELIYTNLSEKKSDIEDHFKITKKMTKLTNHTIKLWSENNTTLPLDLHFDPSDFAKLYGRPDVVLRRQVTELSNRDNDSSLHEYDDDGCMHDDGGQNNDSYDASGHNNDVSTAFSQTIFPTQDAAQEFLGDNLVVAPNRVAKVNIGYARTAKRMDMKRLKTTLWTMLTDVTETNKENDQNGANNKSKVHDDAHEKMEMNENASIQFSSVFKFLPSHLSNNMAENLSCPLAFIALLHLCNERNLALEAVGKMEDFIIRQG